MAIDRTNIRSNSPKKYRYVLDGTNGRVVLSYAPINWADASISLSRDLELAGITAEYIVDSVIFIKDGYRYLRDLFDQRGLFSECNLLVYYYDYTTRTYVEFPTSFRLDFNTYREVKTGRSRNTVNINALPVSLVAKFNTRKKIKVNLNNSTTLDGTELVIKDHWLALKKSLNFDDINSYRYLDQSSSTSTGNFDVSDTDTFLIPFTTNKSDFDESTQIIFAKNATLDETSAFFRDSTEDRSIDIDISIVVSVITAAIGVLTIDIKLDRVDTDGTTLTPIATIDTIPNIVGEYTITYSDTVALLTDQSMIMYGEVAGIGTATLEISTTEITGSEAFVSSPAKAVESIPIYEALERNLQLILDTQYPIYSTKFGRTDTVYNSDGDMYLTEDQLSFANIVNGLCLRGLTLADSDNSVAVSFDDLIKTVNACYNIGVGFEEIGGEDMIVIEDRSYFYTDSVGLDLSGRLTDRDIEFEVFSDLAYAQIKSGFKSFDYEEINGRGEYNTTNERTSPIPNDNVYDIVAPYRADTKGISKMLTNPIFNDFVNETTNTNDVEGDVDIFIIKSQRNGDEWDAETSENIAILNDTSMFKTGSLNLYYTPTRCLLRHGSIIRSGLEIKTFLYLRFQITDKLASLNTTDGIDDITENQNILISDLDASFYEPVMLVFECPFYEADYTTLVANKYKTIKLTDDLSGWLVDFKWKKNKAEFKLLKKYV